MKEAGSRTFSWHAGPDPLLSADANQGAVAMHGLSSATMIKIFSSCDVCDTLPLLLVDLPLNLPHLLHLLHLAINLPRLLLHLFHPRSQLLHSLFLSLERSFNGCVLLL